MTLLLVVSDCFQAMICRRTSVTNLIFKQIPAYFYLIGMTITNGPATNRSTVYDVKNAGSGSNRNSSQSATATHWIMTYNSAKTDVAYVPRDDFQQNTDILIRH